MEQNTQGDGARAILDLNEKNKTVVNETLNKMQAELNDLPRVLKKMVKDNILTLEDLKNPKIQSLMIEYQREQKEAQVQSQENLIKSQTTAELEDSER